MNLALAHCWKEWRAQRGVLVAYSLLAFASLCLAFLLMPDHWWNEDGRGAMSLSWFVAAGVIGVLAFVAPALVRGEFGAKDDQFVRRLPGALRVSFAGKLLFLVLATAALPLLGLAVGELFLTAMDRTWEDLFEWQEAMRGYRIVWPWPAELCGFGLLLAPWVWAVGTWLPGGRMALGGTAALALVLGLCVTAVLRQCPQIEMALAWRGWLWFVAPAGLLVAMVSWTKGRRGGGAMRSARFGGAAFAATLIAPVAWLGGEVSRYHHPDAHRLVDMQVQGITRDRRFVLANASEQANWPGAVFRIDLHTGFAEQIAGIHQFLTTEVLRPAMLRTSAPVRYWRTFDWRDGGVPVNHRVLDLETGTWTAIECDVATGDYLSLQPRLPVAMREAAVADARRTTPLRAPGGCAAWFEGDTLRLERAEGTVSSVPWPAKHERPVLVWPAGHGFVWTNGKGARATFDLTSGEIGMPLLASQTCWFVRGWSVVGWRNGAGWNIHDPAGVSCDATDLTDCTILGLFDDESLLCRSKAASGSPGLFVFDVARRVRRDVVAPRETGIRAAEAVWPMAQFGSLLARDPAGRIWLRAAVSALDNPGNLRQTFVLLDPATLTTRAILPHTRYVNDNYDVLGWPDEHTVLMKRGARILRIDTETLAETVLFPRP